MLERTDSLQAEQPPPAAPTGPGPNRSNSSSAVLSGTGTSAMALLGTRSVLRYHVKNAEQVLFHSTLEPNTEVFSKVSCGVLRSTKFRLNFAKQRRNDMQPS